MELDRTDVLGRVDDVMLHLGTLKRAREIGMGRGRELCGSCVGLKVVVFRKYFVVKWGLWRIVRSIRPPLSFAASASVLEENRSGRY